MGKFLDQFLAERHLLSERTAGGKAPVDLSDKETTVHTSAAHDSDKEAHVVKNTASSAPDHYSQEHKAYRVKHFDESGMHTGGMNDKHFDKKEDAIAHAHKHTGENLHEKLKVLAPQVSASGETHQGEHVSKTHASPSRMQDVHKNTEYGAAHRKAAADKIKAARKESKAVGSKDFERKNKEFSVYKEDTQSTDYNDLTEAHIAMITENEHGEDFKAHRTTKTGRNFHTDMDSADKINKLKHGDSADVHVLHYHEGGIKKLKVKAHRVGNAVHLHSTSGMHIDTIHHT
jgi:hypothetical protein